MIQEFKYPTLYSEEFYANTTTEVISSAKEIVPYLIRLFEPKSIIDVGCGVGEWLKIFSENGVSDYLGIDGYYIKSNMLHIDEKHFLSVDLTNPPTNLKKFDLAVCLEVAEHLEENSADDFIKFLTGLSDIIFFSAATPRQSGVDHRNEQWPEYWQDKFSAHGFTMLDSIRPNFMSNRNVLWWYRQNAFVLVKNTSRGLYPALQVYDPKLKLLYQDVLDRHTKISSFLKYSFIRAFMSIRPFKYFLAKKRNKDL